MRQVIAREIFLQIHRWSLMLHGLSLLRAINTLHLSMLVQDFLGYQIGLNSWLQNQLESLELVAFRSLLNL
jgi:hypothetical protein